MDELRAITLFARAANAGSFQRVAVEMEISPQAVSKAIRQLEGHLGLRLFHRTTRQNSLTTEGLAFLETVRPGLDALTGAIGRARTATEQIQGPIRITAAHASRKVIAGPIARFGELYPEVHFDLRMEDGIADDLADRIDIGFRTGTEPAAPLVARRLFGVQQILCAAPGYLAAHGTPETLADLAQHRCTGIRQRESGRLLRWELMDDGELRHIDVPVIFSSNDPEAELAAVVAGMGIGLIDSVNAASEIRAGRLMPLMPAHASEKLGFYVFHAQRDDMPRRVRAFIDFVVAELRDSRSFRLDAEELDVCGVEVPSNGMA